MEFSHQTRDLECFTDRYSIPWNLPTNSHPIMTVAIQLMSLLLLFVLLFQQCHLSRIDEVSKSDDSTIDLHRIFQIPKSCQWKWRLQEPVNHEFFLTSGSSTEFYGCTDLQRFHVGRKIQNPGKFLFRFSFGSYVMDQRSGDGRFSGWMKNLAINWGLGFPEFWNAGRENCFCFE